MPSALEQGAHAWTAAGVIGVGFNSSTPGQILVSFFRAAVRAAIDEGFRFSQFCACSWLTLIRSLMVPWPKLTAASLQPSLSMFDASSARRSFATEKTSVSNLRQICLSPIVRRPKYRRLLQWWSGFRMDGNARVAQW